MANQKITQLTEATTLADTDLIPVVINTDTVPSNASISKANLQTAVGGGSFDTSTDETITGNWQFSNELDINHLKSITSDMIFSLNGSRGLRFINTAGFSPLVSTAFFQLGDNTYNSGLFTGQNGATLQRLGFLTGGLIVSGGSYTQIADPREMLDVRGDVIADGYKIPSGTSDEVLFADGTKGKPTTITDGITSYDAKTLTIEGAEIDDVAEKVVIKNIASHSFGYKIDFNADGRWLGPYRNYDAGALLDWNRGTGSDAIFSLDTGIMMLPAGSKLKKISLMMQARSNPDDITAYQFQIWVSEGVNTNRFAFPTKEFDITLSPNEGRTNMNDFETFVEDLNSSVYTDDTQIFFAIRQIQSGAGTTFTGECLIRIYYELPTNF